MTNEDNPLAFLPRLEAVIRERMDRRDTQGSYVARLTASGTRRIAQKVGEEGLETALAFAAGGREEQLEEAADLLFHLLVLLQAEGHSLEDVAATLKSRHLGS